MKKMNLSIVIGLVFFSLNLFCQNKDPFQVKIYGTGKQAILLIPGFACSGDVWYETVRHYENNYKCFVFTMAGFAGIEPDSSSSFQLWVKSIAEYIKQNNIAHPIVIGHSLGGGIALSLASDYPDLISKIIVIDALPCLQALTNPAFESNENIDCSMLVEKFKAVSQEQFYRMQKMMMGTLMADTSHMEEAIQWSLKSDRKTLAEIYCQFSNIDLREKISSIKCPSLILLEPNFANTKPEINRQYKNLNTAQIEYANRGLHFIMFDDSIWYFAQADKFLNAI